MKKLFIVLLIGFSIIYVITMIYNNLNNPQSNNIKYTEYKQIWYYQGEVLYPDNIHNDTLIVIRANFLNKILHGSKILNTDKNENLGPDENDEADTITIKNKDNKDDVLINNPASVSVSTLLSICCIPLNGRKLSLPEEYNENNQTDDLSAIVTDDAVVISFQ